VTEKVRDACGHRTLAMNRLQNVNATEKEEE
jgi:hypothetical protein